MRVRLCSLLTLPAVIAVAVQDEATDQLRTLDQPHGYSLAAGHVYPPHPTPPTHDPRASDEDGIYLPQMNEQGAAGAVDTSARISDLLQMQRLQARAKRRMGLTTMAGTMQKKGDGPGPTPAPTPAPTPSDYRQALPMMVDSITEDMAHFYTLLDTAAQSLAQGLELWYNGIEQAIQKEQRKRELDVLHTKQLNEENYDMATIIDGMVSKATRRYRELIEYAGDLKSKEFQAVKDWESGWYPQMSSATKVISQSITTLHRRAKGELSDMTIMLIQDYDNLNEDAHDEMVHASQWAHREIIRDDMLGGVNFAMVRVMVNRGRKLLKEVDKTSDEIFMMIIRGMNNQNRANVDVADGIATATHGLHMAYMEALTSLSDEMDTGNFEILEKWNTQIDLFEESCVELEKDYKNVVKGFRKKHMENYVDLVEDSDDISNQLNQAVNQTEMGDAMIKQNRDIYKAGIRSFKRTERELEKKVKKVAKLEQKNVDTAMGWMGRVQQSTGMRVGIAESKITAMLGATGSTQLVGWLKDAQIEDVPSSASDSFVPGSMPKITFKEGRDEYKDAARDQKVKYKSEEATLAELTTLAHNVKTTLAADAAASDQAIVYGDPKKVGQGNLGIMTLMGGFDHLHQLLQAGPQEIEDSVSSKVDLLRAKALQSLSQLNVPDMDFKVGKEHLLDEISQTGSKVGQMLQKSYTMAQRDGNANLGELQNVQLPGLSRYAYQELGAVFKKLYDFDVYFRNSVKYEVQMANQLNLQAQSDLMVGNAHVVSEANKESRGINEQIGGLVDELGVKEQRAATQLQYEGNTVEAMLESVDQGTSKLRQKIGDDKLALVAKAQQNQAVSEQISDRENKAAFTHTLGELSTTTKAAAKKAQAALVQRAKDLIDAWEKQATEKYHDASEDLDESASEAQEVALQEQQTILGTINQGKEDLRVFTAHAQGNSADADEWHDKLSDEINGLAGVEAQNDILSSEDALGRQAAIDKRFASIHAIVSEDVHELDTNMQRQMASLVEGVKAETMRIASSSELSMEEKAARMEQMDLWLVENLHDMKLQAEQVDTDLTNSEMTEDQADQEAQAKIEALHMQLSEQDAAVGVKLDRENSANTEAHLQSLVTDAMARLAGMKQGVQSKITSMASMHEMEGEPLKMKSTADLKAFDERTASVVGGSEEELKAMVDKVERMISGNAPWQEELPAFVHQFDEQNMELSHQLGEQSASREHRLGLAKDWNEQSAGTLAHAYHQVALILVSLLGAADTSMGDQAELVRGRLSNIHDVSQSENYQLVKALHDADKALDGMGDEDKILIDWAQQSMQENQQWREHVVGLLKNLGMDVSSELGEIMDQGISFKSVLHSNEDAAAQTGADMLNQTEVEERDAIAAATQANGRSIGQLEELEKHLDQDAASELDAAKTDMAAPLKSAEQHAQHAAEQAAAAAEASDLTKAEREAATAATDALVAAAKQEAHEQRRDLTRSLNSGWLASLAETKDRSSAEERARSALERNAKLTSEHEALISEIRARSALEKNAALNTEHEALVAEIKRTLSDPGLRL